MADAIFVVAVARDDGTFENNQSIIDVDDMVDLFDNMALLARTLKTKGIKGDELGLIGIAFNGKTKKIDLMTNIKP